MQDPVSDMLTRIKNAANAGLVELVLPSSRLKYEIAKVMKKEGYIQDVIEEKDEVRKKLIIKLKYHNGKPVIEGIKRVSSPSCRIYCKASDIPNVRSGLGTIIISTSKGIMTGAMARKKNIGGELLCQIW